mmetsp:Transcript_45061/g.107071  ORF Transcript_45061/g.107071 Transcript_45061/m.107071 type:complete len:449 (-) Transcript_45061:58-1404(-)
MALLWTEAPDGFSRSTQPAAVLFELHNAVFDEGTPAEAMAKDFSQNIQSFSSQKCYRDFVCALDIRHKVIEGLFKKHQGQPSLKGQSIGMYKESYPSGESMVKALEPLREVLLSKMNADGIDFEDIPILWMPNSDLDEFDSFVRGWKASANSLPLAVLLLAFGMAPLVVALFTVVFWPARLRSACSAKLTGVPPVLAHYVDGPSPLLSHQVGSTWFPSGAWSGYYDQYGYRHTLCNFDLVFEGRYGSWTMRGHGVDDIGHYTLSGSWNPETLRLGFSKKYQAQSRTSAGIINHTENLGHTVEYRGEALGSIGEGIKGTWWVKTRVYSGRGAFHLWPVNFVRPQANAGAMEEAGLDVPSAPPPSPSAPRFNTTSDGVCVVCFERRINVALEPCGHVAICRTCADALQGPGRSRSCPICRTRIEEVIAFTHGQYVDQQHPREMASPLLQA